MRRLVVLGGGGHGRVVGDAAEDASSDREIVFLDDRYPAMGLVDSWHVLGKISDLLSVADPMADDIIVAIGHNARRLELTDQAIAQGFRSPPIVHPSATVSKRAVVGPGSVVCAGARINTGAIVGRAVIINTGATVDHDCTLADGVHICPGVHLGGNVNVEGRSWVGIGSSVRHSISIGSDVVIGCGAAVVSDVPAGTVSYGVPARPASRTRA